MDNTFRYRIGIVGCGSNMTPKQYNKVTQTINHIHELYDEKSMPYRFLDIHISCFGLSENQVYNYIINKFSVKDEIHFIIYPVDNTYNIDKAYIIHNTSTRGSAIRNIIDNSDIVFFISSTETELEDSSWIRGNLCLDVWSQISYADKRNRRIKIFLPSGEIQKKY